MTNYKPQLSEFVPRHIGPDAQEIAVMTKAVGHSSLDDLINAIVPADIRTKKPLEMGAGVSERDTLIELKKMSRQNKAFKSYIGMGYTDCWTPSVILRNIMENPGWYTQYTPYQSEISQGRLEALLNFQTMVTDLTKLDISNASLLDEATAAAEAMSMAYAVKDPDDSQAFFVSDRCHPQTIAVLQTRAEPLGIKLIIGDHHHFDFSQPIFGALVQYPDTNGMAEDLTDFIASVKKANAVAVVSADLLSLVLLKAPGEMDADIAVGSCQRFGVPLGYGGPHAAYMATKDEYKRKMPGRIVGLSKDAEGRPAIRLALQTREQHIRRDKATSNICTSQVLLAVMASMYAVYHGSEGLKKIAGHVHRAACLLKTGLEKLSLTVAGNTFFDTIKINLTSKEVSAVISSAQKEGMNFRMIDAESIGITVDETTTDGDVRKILSVFHQALKGSSKLTFKLSDLDEVPLAIPPALKRTSAFLTHPVFNTHHSETEMLRYISRLQAKDLSLTTSMIPLGSCTMKLNATTEMIPVTWEGFSKLHPFAPLDQAQGYWSMNKQLEAWLADITGFAAVSLQPNAGSQGEYAGLLVIRKYHQEKKQGHRNVCLIPASAHGTNPATAAMAGMKVVVVKCDKSGNIDVSDLKLRATEHAKDLAALMVTYPSTHGVFEEGIREICKIIHDHGGQVYMDGANMNAQVGLSRPGEFGADVCHLNLHKTFCIPHGGGGPGMGPIGVAAHLKDYLPTHPVVPTGGDVPIGPVSAAPWGSASILPISYAYIRMMGDEGLRLATKVAILNANYIAKKLDPHYPVLYKGKNGLVAHECIIDLRPLKAGSGVEVEDVAKRLMDYGFHAPTVSFPVPGTLMIEPTESESLAELDRFCDAMISIRQEIAAIEAGKMDKENNPLKNAPHTAESIVKPEWNHPYTREQAVYPAAWLKDHKYWPPVARVDNVYGDRNVVCTCAPIEDYEE